MKTLGLCLCLWLVNTTSTSSTNDAERSRGQLGGTMIVEESVSTEYCVWYRTSNDVGLGGVVVPLHCILGWMPSAVEAS